MTLRSIAENIRDELPRLDVDDDTKRALESWLAADREFNTWFLVTTKRQLADDDLLGLLDGYRDAQERVEKAWLAFQDDKDPTKLHASVAISIERMQSLMDK